MSSFVQAAQLMGHRVYSRSFLDWGFLALAACFQLASAQTTFTGITEFLSGSSALSGVVTFAIQAGLILGGERIVQIISSVQPRRTSLIPALLLTAVTFSSSVIFSGFGFYKHYAYEEGNRAIDFSSTSSEVRSLATELERYRTNTLASASTAIKRLEDERRRQDARASNSKLSARLRGISQSRRDQLARQVATLTKMEATLNSVNVIASTSGTSAEQMRSALLDSRQIISGLVAQAMPEYFSEHPLPEGLPTATAPADIQNAFKRDVQQRRPPAMFSLAMATAIDLASLLALGCNIFVSTTEQRIMSVKRKVKHTWNSIFPLADTGDAFSVVRVRIPDLAEENDFEIVFNKPDWALLGSDLEANREAIIERIGDRFSDYDFVSGFYTTAGEQIVSDRPLFEQLADDRVVWLRTNSQSNLDGQEATR